VFILEIIRTNLVVLFSNISMSSGSACSSDGSKKGPGAPRHPVWDHFELTDRNKSNRYTANCNFCNIAFPDARLDNIKKHILAECKDVPSEVRSTVQDEISKEASAPTLLKTAVRKAAKRSAQSSLLDSFDTRAIGPQVQKDLDFSVLRFVVMGGLPFTVVDSPWFLDLVNKLRPAYVPPGRTKLAGHLLVTEHARCKQAIAARIAAAENLTVSIDGWTDEAKWSVYAFNVNFPDGSTALLGSLDLSDETHSGVALAEHAVRWIKEVGANRVSALCTDNASNMVVMRKEVVVS